MEGRFPALLLAIGLAVGLFGSSILAETAPQPPEKTAIRSGCEYDYPPYCIVKENREADGFSVALLRPALKAMGREVTFKTAAWPELKQDLADVRLQVLPLVGRTPEW